MAQALRTRGVVVPVASLIAETGTTVFKVSFGRWVNDGAKKTRLRELIPETLNELKIGVAACMLTSIFLETADLPSVR